MAGKRDKPEEIVLKLRELATIVETGPDPATDGVVRWRRIDLCAVVERRFGVRFAERGMGEILRRLGFARLSARPRHPRHDIGARPARGGGVGSPEGPDRRRHAGPGRSC
jgi:transposase